MSDATNVTLRKVRDILIVELPPTLSAATRDSFNEKVEYAMADTPAVLVLDFGRVAAADDAGMAALDFAFSRTEEIATPLVVAGVAPSIQPLLDKAGYTARAESSFASVDEALKSDL